jgi:hypothetical protein
VVPGQLGLTAHRYRFSCAGNKAHGSGKRDQRPNTTKTEPNDKPLDPGEFGILARDWLKHYWDSPRQKSRWTDVATVILTAIIAAAALYSAWSFSDQLGEMHLQTQLGERAWMGLVGTVTIEDLEMIEPRYKLTAHYQLKNFGHGPAYKIITTGWFSTNLQDLKMMGDHACDTIMPFTEGTIQVGPGIPQPPPLGTMRFPDQTLDEIIGERNDPFTGDYVPNLKKIWFVGCVTYKDQFKATHWTRWCVTSPDSGPVTIDKNVFLHFCNLYNDTDDK